MPRRTIFSISKTCAAVIGVAVLLIIFTPLVRVAAESLATDWYEGNGDVLVVLGGSMLINGTGPNATLGYNSYLRSVYAAWYLENHNFPVVIASGGDGLAEAMAKFLEASGVPASSILLESRSHTTYENAVYVKALLKQHSLLGNKTRIVILTSDYHSWRASRVFKHQGMDVRVVPVPDVTKRSGSLPYRLDGFFTIAGELTKNLVYVAERKM